MRAFINCSEPVQLQSHQVFLEKFSGYGVRGSALSTCYAMAENTFAVTQHRIGEPTRVDWVSTHLFQEERIASPAEAGAPGSKPVVSCGSPIAGTKIRVVNDKGSPLPDRHAGEIVLRSNCMMSGYYQRHDLTQAAVLDGWYFTGDMGYVSDGELYLTGRKKDLIIVGGKNIYPQDLEAIANGISGLYSGALRRFWDFRSEPGIREHRDGVRARGWCVAGKREKSFRIGAAPPDSPAERSCSFRRPFCGETLADQNVQWENIALG